MNNKTRARRFNKYLTRITVISCFLFSMNSSALANPMNDLVSPVSQPQEATQVSIAPDEAIPSFPSITFQSTSAAIRESYEKLHGSDLERNYNVPFDEEALFQESLNGKQDTEDRSAEYSEAHIKTNIAFIWSRILLKSAGIPEENHFLLRHNLSCYLAQGGSSYRLKRLYNNAQWNMPLYFSELQLHPRFEFKLIRELNHPYTDTEAMNQVIKLESQVREVFEAVKSVECSEDFTLFAVGSFARGRIGANSDLDTYFITNNDEAKEKILELPFAQADLNSEAEVNFMVQPKISKFLLGKSVCLGEYESFLGQTNPMVDIYGAVLSNNFGIIMTRDKSSNLHFRYSTDSTEDKLWKRETNKLLEATWRIFSDIRHGAGNIASWVKERFNKE